MTKPRQPVRIKYQPGTNLVMATIDTLWFRLEHAPTAIADEVDAEEEILFGVSHTRDNRCDVCGAKDLPVLQLSLAKQPDILSVCSQCCAEAFATWHRWYGMTDSPELRQLTKGK